MEYVDAGTSVQGRRTAAAAFEAAYGEEPQVVGRGPGRVNLIGEHTDYNGGLCLPLTLSHATYAAVSDRADNRIRITSDAGFQAWEGDLGTAHLAQGWAAYVAGVIWALGHPRGVDVMVHSTVPIGGGLSSSAALECSVAVALTQLAGHELDDERRHALVAACVKAETDVAGAPTGGLDQSASLLAPTDGALLIDFGTDESTNVSFPITDDGLALLVIDTGVHHSLASSEYGVRRKETSRAAELLEVAQLGDAPASAWDRLEDYTLRRRARHQITENARVRDAVAAIGRNDWRAVGELFVGSHASLRDDYEVSCEELDVAVATAVDAGALGARMTGGGFGGSAIALVSTTALSDVAGAVEKAYRERGWARPSYLEAGGPSEPAAVVHGRGKGGVRPRR